MRKTIAKWLRSAADRLDGRQSAALVRLTRTEEELAAMGVERPATCFRLSPDEVAKITEAAKNSAVAEIRASIRGGGWAKP